MHVDGDEPRVFVDVVAERLSVDLVVGEAVLVDAGPAIDLERALATLRPPERVCIVLCFAEGMSHGEVARATGFPLGTVKSHIARGTAKLRTLLEPK